jgi:phage tail-like protein
MQSRRGNFRYLNREGKWLNFNWRGLEVSAQGALRLLSAPRLVAQSASQLTNMAAPVAPSGIAVDDSGRIFYSIPEENRIVAGGGCDSAHTPLTCLTEGAGLGSLNAPRGLLVLRQPERLVIADSGNDRLLFCDLRNFDLREVWGQVRLSAWPSSSDAPDRFNNSWDVAADEDGKNIYVLDSGNARILKFARTGEPDTEFLGNVQKSCLVSCPGALTVGGRGTKVRVYVSDLAANTIFVFDESGNPVPDNQGLPVAIEWPGMGGVLALAVNETTLFVGDNDQQRILSFGLTSGFPFSGEAAGFHGYTTALSIDSRSGNLLVRTCDAAEPLSLEPAGAYLNSGVLWSDAICAGTSPVDWNRLRASVTNAPGSHIEFYYKVSACSTHDSVDPTADNPFSDEHWKESERWHALPQDVEDFLLEGDKNLYLFVGARFLSDRTGTPLLTQMRADFDTESYTRFLPAIYREPAAQSDFLRRFVSLFQGLFEDIEEEVDSLERYFDAFAAPPEALIWLATWLAVELDQGEPEARMRQSIARAFRRYQWRGTIEGLRLALLEDAGVHATISEPIAARSFWAIPPAADCSGRTGSGAAPQLGMGTQLTSMEPGGAVLGSTATLDRSYLITDAQFGEPLFESVAWQFMVEVYRGEVNTDARLQLVKEIIEREKPAHTMYSLSLIDSRMRAGFQSRAGVDTIISGTPGPTPLGQDGGFGLRLGGPLPPRIGVSHLGEDLKL